MEYTILGCDLCPKRPKPRNAVGTREVDLCRCCIRRVDRARGQRPRGRPKGSVNKPRRKYHRGISYRKGAAAENLKFAEGRLLHALKRAGAEGLKGAALARAVKLDKNLVGKAARSLAKKGLVKKNGARRGWVLKEAA